MLLLTKFLSFLFSPIFRLLGYQSGFVASAHHLPSSRYYEGQPDLVALFSVHRGYLKSSGWLESKSTNRSMRSGKPIPWLTFSSIHFLESLDLSEARVLEIGGGASSLYWEDRVASIVTLEAAGPWADAVEAAFSKPSSTLLRIEIDEAKFDSDTHARLAGLMDDADVLVVDGGNRNAFLEMAALAHLKLLVVDNTDRREELASGLAKLQSEGWACLPFAGLGPLNSYGWETSVFFKSISVLRHLQLRQELQEP